MKKTIAITSVSLFLFVISLLITIHHVRGMVMEDAKITTQKFNDRAATSLESILTNGQRVAYSILSGYFFNDIDSTLKNSTSQELLKHSRFLITEKDRKLLTIEDLYLTLEDFVRVNPSCHSAAFYMEPDAFPNEPEKYRGLMVFRNFEPNETKHLKEYEKKGIKRTDYHDIFEFEKSDFYQEATSSGYQNLWRKNSWSNEKNGFLISYYAPIIRDNGKTLGVFGMSIPLLDFAYYIIEKGLPYQNSHMKIYDKDDVLILSTATATADTLEHLSFKTTVASNDWKIVTYISEKEIYAAAQYVQKILWIMSILAIVFVSIAAASISRFLRKNLKQKALLTSELKLANKIQMDILQPSIHEAEKFSLNAVLQPAKDVGGDLYDYHIHKAQNENDHDTLYFIIGDVSGKGMPAALMMTQVCSLFRNIVRQKPTPEEILKGINNVLAERNDLMMFCTAFIGAINLDTLEMHYANAGHDMPVITPGVDGVPDKANAYYLKVKPNAPVAIMENRSFEGDFIQLQKGSQVLVYTDGVTEAMNKSHEQFGEEKLLSAVQHGDSLFDSVKAHAQNAEQSDDITILKIQL